MAVSPAIEEIDAFLGCATSEQWLQCALKNQVTLLIDHAHCEHKAAASAMRLMHRYPGDTELVLSMSRLAREELRHFEQVLAQIKKRQLRFSKLPAARYAAGLLELKRRNEPACLVDLLIVGAFIEARSCERFARLVPLLEPDLSALYAGLLASEARHFQQYIKLARKRAATQADLGQRVQEFRNREAELIQAADAQFRFHSGVPEPSSSQSPKGAAGLSG